MSDEIQTNAETPEQKKPAPKVEMTSPCKSPTDHAPYSPDEALAMVMDSYHAFNEAMEKSPNMKYTADESGRRWLQFLAQAAAHLPRGGALSETVEREGSQWRQYVDNNGELLTPGRPRIGKEGEGVRLSGERAIFRLTQALGLGTVVQVPLWHSGIWVTLRAPAMSSLLELERRIAEEKIELGRHTAGMIYSNTAIYTNYHLLNFILNHVYDSSLKVTNPKNLKRSILITDFPLLVWGILCAIYPNGYNFSQPCSANPEQCHHVTTERINITKLLWTDNSALSVRQKAHMAKRTEKFQHEDLVRYQEEHTYGLPKTVRVHDNLSVKLRVPTLEQYEKAGFKWVDGIERMVQEAFGVELEGEARNDYINMQGRVTALRQYAHWIKEIHLSDGAIIDDEDTIDESLDRLSADVEISRRLLEEIGKYIDESTISLIAIPKYNCPACGKEQGEGLEYERYPHLIPQEVSQVFFTLLNQRIERLIAAPT